MTARRNPCGTGRWPVRDRALRWAAHFGAGVSPTAACARRRARLCAAYLRLCLFGRYVWSLRPVHASRRARLWATTLAWALPLSACAPAAPPTPESANTTFERGPLRLTVSATPKAAQVGDAIAIELRVETPDDYVVQFPKTVDFGELQPDTARTAAPQSGAGNPAGMTPPAPLPAAETDKLVWRYEASATAYTSGVVEIPPQTVRYARKPEDPAAAAEFDAELTSEPLQIEVRSALTSQDSVQSPRDITATLVPPGRPLTALEWAGLIAGTLTGLALIAALAYWLRRLANRPAPPVAPEVWALRELSMLSAADWLAAEQVRAYYYRLTEIVRQYIERKFSLAAPEMTSEEFLTALSRNRRALPYDAGKLRAFLEACDIVKYAAFQPAQQDGEQALQHARSFVHATAAAAEQMRPACASDDEARGAAA